MNSNKEIIKFYKKSRKSPKRFNKLHYIDEVQDMRGDLQTYLQESGMEIVAEVDEDQLKAVTVCNVCHKVNVCFTGIYTGCGPTCRVCKEKEKNIPARKPSEWFSRVGSAENPVDLTRDYGKCSNCLSDLLLPNGIGERHLCTPCYLDNLFGRKRIEENNK